MLNPEQNKEVFAIYRVQYRATLRFTLTVECVVHRNMRRPSIDRCSYLARNPAQPDHFYEHHLMITTNFSLV